MIQLAILLAYFADPLTVTTQGSLSVSSSPSTQAFGSAMSASGDTLLVGAPARTVAGASNRGEVFVYVRSGTSWVQQASLQASDGGTGDRFGTSVFVNGDLAIIGAPQDSNPGFGQGSAYIFQRTGTTWTEVTKLLDADGFGGHLGQSVYATTDWALVGAPDRPNGGGCVYYERLGAFWFQVATISGSDTTTSDRFGYSISGGGDEVVVGAPYDDSPQVDSGSAFVFQRSGSSWTETGKLTDPQGSAGDTCGWSVSLNGDTIVLGSPLADYAPLSYGDAGAVSAFVRNGGSWAYSTRLLDATPVFDRHFGQSVLCYSDGVVCGDDVGSDADTFALIDGVWCREAVAPQQGNSFGRALAYAPGYLFVGIPGDTTTGGKVYRFRFTRTSAFTEYCFGDGTGTSCPCGNNGSAGNGCGSSVNPSGARLTASGNDMLQHDTVTLSLSGTGVFAPGLYFQGTQWQNGGLGNQLGDGLACVGGTAIRLAVKSAIGGASTFPDPNVGDPLLSIRGQIPAIGGTRYYQVWYRNNAVFCAPETFNLSNAVSVVWVP